MERKYIKEVKLTFYLEILACEKHFLKPLPPKTKYQDRNPGVRILIYDT